MEPNKLNTRLRFWDPILTRYDFAFPNHSRSPPNFPRSPQNIPKLCIWDYSVTYRVFLSQIPDLTISIHCPSLKIRVKFGTRELRVRIQTSFCNRVANPRNRLTKILRVHITTCNCKIWRNIAPGDCLKFGDEEFYIQAIGWLALICSC